MTKTLGQNKLQSESSLEVEGTIPEFIKSDIFASGGLLGIGETDKIVSNQASDLVASILKNRQIAANSAGMPGMPGGMGAPGDCGPAPDAPMDDLD